jgi:hypothetical protein
LFVGPDWPDDYSAWLAGMRACRREMQPVLQAARGDLPDPHAEPALQWAQRSFIQPQLREFSGCSDWGLARSRAPAASRVFGQLALNV